MHLRLWAGTLLAANVAASNIALAEGGVVRTRIIAHATEGSEPGVEVTFGAPQVSVQTSLSNSGYVQVMAPGFSRIGAAGLPDLPTTGVMLAVPEGFRLEATVVNETHHKLVSSSVVQPYVRQWRCSVDNSDSGTESILYTSTARYPESSFQLEDVGMLQGVKLVRLAYFPVQMDFARRSADVTDSLTVRLEMIKSNADVKATALPEAMLRIVRQATVNGSASSHIVRASGPERMLIVTADQFKNSIAPLVAWKRNAGLTVDVVTYSEAGRSKEAVLRYIQDDYNTHSSKPTYLLLVGNGTTMPPFRRSTSSGSAASDYPFTLLSGTDIVPDVIVGRLMADNEVALQTQMTKWMQYERNPDIGADWYSHGTTIASREGGAPSDVGYAEGIQAFMKAGTYTAVDQFYEGPRTATAANITAALNEGRSWLTYIGHGSGTSWGSTNTNFSNSTIATLTNKRLPVIVDVACDNGSFVDIPTCFGEAWVNQKANGVGAGAVGYWGASVSTSWDEPAVMATGIAKRHFENHINSLGGSLLAGQIYLIEQMGSGANVVDNLEWYNLFGDPSMTMRTSAPAGMEMTYDVMDVEGVVLVNVKVIGVSGPVSGANVSLTSADGATLHGLGATDAAGLVSFPVASGTSLQGAHLTASGYNLGTRELAMP